MGDFAFILWRNGLVVSFDEVFDHPESKVFGMNNSRGSTRVTRHPR